MWPFKRPFKRKSLLDRWKVPQCDFISGSDCTTGYAEGYTFEKEKEMSECNCGGFIKTHTDCIKNASKLTYNDIDAASDANEILKLQRENPDKEYVAVLKGYFRDRLAYQVKEPKIVKIPEREFDELIEEMDGFRCAYENVMLPRIANRGSRIYSLIQQLKGYKE